MRLDRKISSLELLTYRHYRIVHGVRIGLAFILTFLLIRLLAVPEGTWPLITLVVVMGPISFWGNVLQRALQRIAGTVFGAASGLIALYLELYSLPLMLAWCGVVMFVCGYLTLGKRPYMALLVGITLAVVCGAGAGDMHTALWRSGDVIFGSLLALLFTSIYPQRAYILWRMQGPQEQRQAAAGQLAEIAGELKTLMQEVSLGQHGEAPIYGYVWLSMELAQQLEELGDLLLVCTAAGRE